MRTHSSSLHLKRTVSTLVFYINTFVVPGSYYTICRGGPTRHVKEGTEEDVPAKLVILYPDYNKIPIDNDIAAIEVNKKVRYSLC